MSEALNCSEEEIPNIIEMFKAIERQRRNAKEIEGLDKQEADLEVTIKKQSKIAESKTMIWNEIRSVQHQLRELYEQIEYS